MMPDRPATPFVPKSINHSHILRRYITPWEPHHQLHQDFDRKAHQLGIPPSIQRDAEELCRQMNVRGRAGEIIATASFYLAYRYRRAPISFREFCKRAGQNPKQVWRLCQSLIKVNRKPLPPVDPVGLTYSVTDKIPVPATARQLMTRMLNDLGDELVGHGYSPRTVAASSYYVSMILDGHPKRREYVGELFNVSAVSVVSPLDYCREWVVKNIHDGRETRLPKELRGRRRGSPPLPRRVVQATAASSVPASSASVRRRAEAASRSNSRALSGLTWTS